MNFSEALERIKQGYRLARAGWSAPGQWIEIQVPDENSKMSLPYLYVNTTSGECLVPWQASQCDVLAEDWVVVPTPTGELVQ